MKYDKMQETALVFGLALHILLAGMYVVWGVTQIVKYAQDGDVRAECTVSGR